MPRGGKAAHVHPDLRYEGFGGPTIDAGDGAKERHLLLAERGDHPLDLFAKARYGLVQVVDVGHYLAHYEGMIWEEKHPSRASRSAGSLERRRPRANSASTSGSVVPPTSASAQEPFRRHQARAWLQKRALSRHLGAPSPDVGPPLCAPRFLSRAVAGEVPKLPDLFRWHEAGAHQPVLHKLADPLGVLDVGLPTGDVLEVPGVEKPQLEVVLQHVVDGLPVHSGGFHAHQPHPKGSQPVPQQQESSSGGGELSDLLVEALALVGDPHTRSNRGLVHVEPGTSFDEPVQILSLRSKNLFRRQEEPLS